MAARRWLTAVLRPTPVTKTARQRRERTSEHRRIKRGTPKGQWFDGEVGPHAQYHGGAPLTPASSPFRLSHEGVGHYIFGGGTTTGGAPHAHPISTKDQLQRENGRSLPIRQWRPRRELATVLVRSELYSSNHEITSSPKLLLVKRTTKRR
jgi:hypothetical protein